MTQNLTPELLDEKILIGGIHLELTEALKSIIRDKVSKLLRHEPRIIRVRVQLDYDKTKGSVQQFVAKGIIEINGPDIVASAASEDAYKSIDELVQRLDRGLRKRSADRLSKRAHPHGIDIGAGVPKTA
jgi:putative sigma-54 modulation protein